MSSNKSAIRSIALAGLLTGIIDGTFSSVLSVAFYHSTVERLFQGVASVLLGPEALKGGASTMWIGILLHFGVAFAWSAIFVLIAMRIPAVRRRSSLTLMAVYGPFIWMVMSLVLIPLMTGRPPTITYRWWIQFFGHIPFVAAPIILATRRANH